MRDPVQMEFELRCEDIDSDDTHESRLQWLGSMYSGGWLGVSCRFGEGL